MLTQLPGRKDSSATPDQNPAVVYLAGLSSVESKRTMRAALNNVAVLGGARTVIQTVTAANGRVRQQDITYLRYDWAALTPKQVGKVCAKLRKLYKPASINKMLSALRGVLKTAYTLGQMSAEDYQQALQANQFKNEPCKPSDPHGRRITLDDLSKLVEACRADLTPAGKRDLAMLAVWASAGLRRTELVGLDLADLEPSMGRVVIRSHQGQRSVYLAGAALVAVQTWLVVRDLRSGPLFCGITKLGKLTGQRLSAQAAYNALKKRAAQAGLGPFSPHDFRRTFVADLLERGIDLPTVAELGGYSSLSSLLRYDPRSEETKRKVAGMLNFPA